MKSSYFSLLAISSSFLFASFDDIMRKLSGVVCGTANAIGANQLALDIGCYTYKGPVEIGYAVVVLLVIILILFFGSRN